MKCYIKLLLLFWKCIIPDILLLTSQSKDSVEKDVDALRKIGAVKLDGVCGFNQAFLSCKQFRNIFFLQSKAA